MRSAQGPLCDDGRRKTAAAAGTLCPRPSVNVSKGLATTAHNARPRESQNSPTDTDSIRRGALLLLGRLFFDVFDDVADRLEFFRIFVRHFDSKFFFKSHHQFDNVQ